MGRIALQTGTSLALVVLVAACHRQPRTDPTPAPIDPAYSSAVQPVFDRRCLPCHACFDSPCQFNLQSFAGLDRGASQKIVYHPQRLVAERPTRLFQDAKTTWEWQSPPFDFVTMVNRAAPEQSILWHFLAQPPLGSEARAGHFDVNATTTCPRSLAEADTDLREHPERVMPFGFPPLTSDESEAIWSWLRRGAGGPPPPPAEPKPLAVAIATWEGFLNAPDLKQRLVSAYLFEHLFYAHLHFDIAPGEQFRLVRSRATADGSVDEIATRRPYDDPGQPFVYRLSHLRETLVEKTHAPYELSEKKLARLRAFGGSWTATEANPFDPKVAANPFLAFAAIPARARYQFMLDDAHYHVQTFIHGPVCRGQAALDVIDEHFYILFLSPERDPAVSDPAYLASVAPFLSVPADDSGKIELVYDALVLRHVQAEDKYLAAQLPQVAARSLADIWNGDGTNPQAVLTVYRHFDNAFVLDGAIGGIPKTVWIMDYPIFERTYYDLVAGFDVYGNAVHQVGTRVYENLLRIEAEGQFLRMLPARTREALHDSWYRGRIARELAGIHAASYAGPEPRPDALITQRDPGHAKEELVTRLLTQRLSREVVGGREPIQWPDVPFSANEARAHFERLMRGIVRVPASSAAYVLAFPDASLLRIRTRAGEDLVYTIARNRSHRSVEFIWPESVELEPQEDTLEVIPGIATSRPNLLLTTTEDDLDAFAAAWKSIGATGGTAGGATGGATGGAAGGATGGTAAGVGGGAAGGAGGQSFSAFLDKYGARRSAATFWETYDSFNEDFQKMDPIGAAALDLSRYIDG